MNSKKVTNILYRVIDFELSNLMFLLIGCILLIVSMIGVYVELSSYEFPETEYKLLEETISDVKSIDDAVNTPYFDKFTKTDGKIIINYKLNNIVQIKQTADLNFDNIVIRRNYLNSKDILDQLLLIGIFVSFSILSLSVWLIYTIFIKFIKFCAKKALNRWRIYCSNNIIDL